MGSSARIAGCEQVQRILFTVMAVVIVSGCTSRQLYRYGQEYQRDQCRAGPPAEYEECMKRADESYETYQRNKKEVEKDQ